MRQISLKTRVLNKQFLTHIKRVIKHCEWPEKHGDCAGPLQACHIKAKGMGGGFTRDAPDNVTVLCMFHHAHMDNTMGQSWETQQWLKQRLKELRPKALQKHLWEVFETTYPQHIKREW